MSFIKKLIKNLIEEQNELELEKVLTENPQFNLNTLSSNNLSALWLALCPRPPKLPSNKIISLLIARNQIDPSQQYNGQTIRSYYHQLFNRDEKILKLLTDYENRYNYGQNNNIVGEEDERLRRFADHGQNVHSAVVEDSVKKSASNLYRRYIKNSQFNWSKPLKDLELWLGLDGYDLNLKVAPAESEMDENTLYFTLNNKALSVTCIDAKTKQKTTSPLLPQINWQSPLTTEQLKLHLSNILKEIKKQGTCLKSLGLDLYSAKKSFDRIINLNTSYQCSAEISLNGNQALALGWLGISSLNPNEFVENIDMSSNEVRDRKRLYIDTLINIQNEYGIDVTSCEGGTFNHLISRLDCIHIDVKISESTALNQELINHKYLAFCQKKLQTLVTQDPALFWKYIQYYQFEDLPVGLSHANCPKELVIKINNFNESASAEFVLQIKKENSELQEEDERTDRKPAKHMKKDALDLALTNVTFMIEESGLALGNLPLLNKLAYFYQKINSSTTNCFGFGREAQNHSIKVYMNKAIIELISKESTKLEQVFSDLGGILSSYPIDLVALEKHLYPLSEAYGHFFNNLDTTRKENFLKDYWSIYAKALPRTQIDNKDESIFWTLVQDDFLKEISILQKWFCTFPEDLAKEFIKSLIQKNYHLVYKIYASEIQGLALNLALKEEYLSNFPLDKPLIFENQDLKGIDLSSLNLQQIRFINCDLALTNIINNPTFKPEHIETNHFDFQILKKVDDLLKENPNISLSINWLPISDKNVLIYMDYLIQKNYFQIANLILKLHPNLKFYSDQGGQHLNTSHIIPSVDELYECLSKLKRHFLKNKLGDETLTKTFLNAYKELSICIEKRKNENSIELSLEEKEKAGIVIKCLAKLVNSLNFDELHALPDLPFNGDLYFIDIDEELKELLHQPTYAKFATENNFLENTLFKFHNRIIRCSKMTSFIANIINHKNFSINLFTRHEGSQYNPFNSLVSSSVLSNNNTSFKVIELILNNDYLTFSSKELDLIRSQFFKGISKHDKTFNNRFHTLYKLFLDSELYSFDECNEWILKRINFEKENNIQFFITALFSEEFVNHFDEFNNANPQSIKDSFEYCISKAVNSNSNSDAYLVAVLCHPYCTSKTLSFIENLSRDNNDLLLQMICSSDEIKNKFLSNNDLSEFIKNQLLNCTLPEYIILPNEWKQAIKKEGKLDNETTVNLQEDLSPQIENDKTRIKRFKAIYKALYEGQSSCFKHWNTLVDKENLTVKEIEEYVKFNEHSRSDKAWVLANDFRKERAELFEEIHHYAYLNSSSFFGLFRESKNFPDGYDNLEMKLSQAEKGSRTESISSLLKIGLD
jgi:hypothetical protein